MSKEQQPLIHMEGLSYTYGEGETAFRALKDINLQIHSGEFVAITGASGSGKSTLMNLLGSLATAYQGSFDFAGSSPQELEAEELASLRNRSVGFVFQQFHLLPKLSVFENVLLPLAYVQPRPSAAERQEHERQALSLLQRLGIAEQKDKLPALLSGGQKQRVAIARALLLNPSMLLADEPTGALDSKSSREVMEIFAELHAEGKTVVLITHDPEVTRCAHRRIELKDGVIVFDGKQEGMIAPIKSSQDAISAELNQALAPRRWETLRQAWRSLTSSKLRTVLTSIGLIIGVSAITSMITLGSAAQDVILKIFDRAGADRVYIGLDWQASRTNTNGYWQGVHVDYDLPQLRSMFQEYGNINMLWNDINQNAVVAGRSIEVKVDSFNNLQDLKDLGIGLQKGRFFQPGEFAQSGLVALVGSEFVEQMFPSNYEGRWTNLQFPLGEQIALRGKLQITVTIVGELKARDTTFSERGVNARLYIPVSTLSRYTGDKRSTWISVLPKPGVSHRWLADSVVNYLKLKTNLKFPFRAEVPEEQIGKIMMFITIFQGLTALIGGLCILVGGIGIMNIMLVTITERIKEIGLRKALGARNQDIKSQFLLECLLLCLASGVIGVLLGALFCNFVGVLAHFAVPDTIPSKVLLNPLGISLGIGTALVCGLSFGMMPAIRAAKLDPSDALRSE